MCFGCCSDSGTNTVIFHTLKIIHKHTQKQSLPKDLLLKPFNNGCYYEASLRLNINVSSSPQVRQKTEWLPQKLNGWTYNMFCRLDTLSETKKTAILCFLLLYVNYSLWSNCKKTNIADLKLIDRSQIDWQILT